MQLYGAMAYQDCTKAVIAGNSVLMSYKRKGYGGQIWT